MWFFLAGFLYFKQESKDQNRFKTCCPEFTHHGRTQGIRPPNLPFLSPPSSSPVGTALGLLSRRRSGVFSPRLSLSQLPCVVTFNQAGSICVFTLVRSSLPLKNHLGIWAEQIYRQANTSSPQHISCKAKPIRVLGGLRPRLARAINPLWRCPHRDPQGHFVLTGPQGRSKTLHGVHTTAYVTQRRGASSVPHVFKKPFTHLRVSNNTSGSASQSEIVAHHSQLCRKSEKGF